MKTALVTASVFAVALLGSCAQMESVSKETIGTIGGAVIGGVAGSQIGGGRGRIVGAVVGVAAGAFAGKLVGKYLDDRDKQRLAQSTVKTADTGETQTTTSPESGTKIMTTAISPPKPSATAEGTQICRAVRQTIVLRDGKQESEDVTVCKTASGEWKPAA